ncbi:MAG: glycosyltransferase [Bacteroidaceae bacterium]|nr:glycosyltransferase [Bacteroidaceae bacterium]
MPDTLNTLVTLIDWTLFVILALNVTYVLFFAVCSLFHRSFKAEPTAVRRRFLVLLPAYAEDKVIVDSARSAVSQDYPRDCFEVAVISDHMSPATDELIRSVGAQCLVATYDNSSKAKALQLAMNHYAHSQFDYVVILDADNRVEPGFLSQLNLYCCATSAKAVQCHRTSRASRTDVQQLDSVSEEINNSVFRRGHVAAGISSALIGSGMCFECSWFQSAVGSLRTAGEDKELEKLLLQQRIFIHYARHIDVYDQKTSGSANFQNQRKRWMAAQWFALRSMLRDITPELCRLNIGYVDKTLQQALVPRSFCIVLLALLTLLTLPLQVSTLKWLALDAMFVVAMLIAIPRRLYGVSVLRSALRIPQLVFLMTLNLFRLRGIATKFIHTEHNEE